MAAALLLKPRAAVAAVIPAAVRFLVPGHGDRELTARGGLLAGGPGSVQDQLRDLLRVGDQREVAAVDLDRRGIHPFCEEALKIRRDRAVLP